MILISLLTGIFAAGLFWFSVDLLRKLLSILSNYRQQRKLRAEARALEAAKQRPPEERAEE